MVRVASALVAVAVAVAAVVPVVGAVVVDVAGNVAAGDVDHGVVDGCR